MASLLAVLTFLLGFVLIGNLQPEWGWRRCFLRSSLLFSAGTIVILELLSVFSAVQRTTLLWIWSLGLGVVLFFLLRIWRQSGKLRLPVIAISGGWGQRIILLSVILILIVTAIVAWFAPPHNWESLRYHMARVAHWAQINSVEHFATGIEIQNSMPPGAEILVLNAYLLAQSDRLVNFVSWFAMLGSVIGVSLIAKQLGAGSKGQIFAAVFVATLPMGIIQASSTMNDYVLAFWLVCLASEILTWSNNPEDGWPALFIGTSTGLSLLTKGTAITYLIPFGLMVLIVSIHTRRPFTWFKEAAIVILLVLLLNGGHVLRTYKTYGQPISQEQVALHRNELFNLPLLTSNIIRNAGLHASTPWPHVNKASTLAVFALHDLMGIDPNDPRTTNHSEFRIQAIFLNEDRTGNPVHMLLLVGTVGILLVNWKLVPHRIWIYWVMVAATFVLMSAIFKWQIFGSRYHLGFFVLYAPIVGFSLDQFSRKSVIWSIAAILVLLSLNPLMRMDDKPLIQISENDGETSILKAPRNRLYFIAEPRLTEPVMEITQSIRQKECQTIGLSLSGAAAEYPWWVMLGAPNRDLLIEWLVAGAPSSKYAAGDFSPCAVICDKSCPDEWTSVHGLPLAYQRAGFRLFIQP